MKQSARTTILTLWGALVTALALSLSITAPAVALDPGGREEALPTTPPPDPSVPSIGTTVLSDGTPVGIVVAGGNGGGKPDFAMAGAKDLTKIDEALAAVNTIVSEMVKE